MTLPAGSQCCFDTATFHTSMPNLITEPGQGGGYDHRSRCTVETDYRSSGGLGGTNAGWENVGSSVRNIHVDTTVALQRRKPVRHLV